MLYNISSKANNRINFFNQIKNNDYHCVIMSHDQFGKIPQSLEMQQQILQAELDTVDENLEVVKQQGHDVSRGILKGLIKRKENLTAKIATIQYQMDQNKDAVVDFKQMGIDHIFVDESHYQNFLRLPIFTHIALNFNDSAIALVPINFMLGHSPTKTLNDSIKIETKVPDAPSDHEGHRLRWRLHR